jgi:hypothetical protein
MWGFDGLEGLEGLQAMGVRAPRQATVAANYRPVRAWGKGKIESPARRRGYFGFLQAS